MFGRSGARQETAGGEEAIQNIVWSCMQRLPKSMFLIPCQFSEHPVHVDRAWSGPGTGICHERCLSLLCDRSDLEGVTWVGSKERTDNAIVA